MWSSLSSGSWTSGIKVAEMEFPRAGCWVAGGEGGAEGGAEVDGCPRALAGLWVTAGFCWGGGGSFGSMLPNSSWLQIVEHTGEAVAGPVPGLRLYSWQAPCVTVSFNLMEDTNLPSARDCPGCTGRNVSTPCMQHSSPCLLPDPGGNVSFPCRSRELRSLG